jgi:hypothetical protein
MKKLAVKLFTVVLVVSFFIQADVQGQELVSYEPEEQNFDQVVDIDQFNVLLMQYLVLGELNIARKKAGVDQLKAEKLLSLSARGHATDMAEMEEYRVEGPEDFAMYVVEQEGSDQVNGVTSRMAVKSGKEFLPYRQLAQNIVGKWLETTKYVDIVKHPAMIFVGIGAELDLSGRKLYVSLITGNYFTYPNNLDGAVNMEFPPGDKDQGLAPYYKKLCRKIESDKIYDLQKGISVKDNIIYFETDNMKEFKKIIKSDSRDGLAIDILQKEQYPCDADNLIDYDFAHRGVLLKPIYANKLYDYNEYEGKEARSKLKTEIGEIPYELAGPYELNLVIIKDKTFCKSIPQGFLNDSRFKPYQKLEYLADTVTINSQIDFIPEAVDDEFLLRFPYNRGKTSFSYNSDIKPQLESLNAPPFVINEINVASFTSIETSSNRDMIQIHKNAENLLEAFRDYQDEEFDSDIITSNGWSLFKTEVIGTEYESLAFMNFQDALTEIRNRGLTNELESIFSKHRFGQVQLRVIYDLRGEKEQDYVLHHFNKAIDKGNLPVALAIQKYIMKTVANGKYDKNAITNQKIPLETKYAGLVMNKLWLQLGQEQIDEKQFYTSVKKLTELAPDNKYIAFNHLQCVLKFEDVGDEYEIYKVQTAIDRLYGGSVNDNTIDALNLEYQFMIIAALDTLDKPTQPLFTSLEKIKSIVNLEVSSWNNSLQLAYLFIDHRDYDFARKVLEVFIEDTKLNEELLFTYLSLCSYSDYKFVTGKFERAMKRAEEINPERYCQLFDGKHFSLRILENPNIKKQYCQACK